MHHHHHTADAKAPQAYNRLDKVVLDVGGTQTPLTAADARALAAALTAAAEKADQIPDAGARATPSKH